MREEPLLKGRGDYHNLLTFQKATYVLRKQVEHLGELFLNEGGLRERMTRMRLEEQKK